MKIGERSVVVV